MMANRLILNNVQSNVAPSGRKAGFIDAQRLASCGVQFE
jgi:hypothetical protein